MAVMRLKIFRIRVKLFAGPYRTPYAGSCRHFPRRPGELRAAFPAWPAFLGAIIRKYASRTMRWTDILRYHARYICSDIGHSVGEIA